LVDAEVQAALPAGVEDAYPVSQLQQGMLYHTMLQSGAGIYHDIVHYRIGLDFDENSLRKALELLTDRHAILRTGIDLESYPVPLQLVYRQVLPQLSVIPLESDIQSGLQAWQQHELQHGFAKDSYPLIRFAALLTRAGVWYLGFSFHHAILDGWSEASLMAELLSTYSGLLNGQSTETLPLRSTYRDFIVREQAALNDPVQRDYWQSFDDSALSRVQLPCLADVKEDEYCLDTAVSETVSYVLDSEQSKALRRLAIEQGCSLKTVLLCAHLKTLSLACAKDHVVSGVSFHGRPEVVDSEKVLGLFVNVLPVALSVQGGSWIELINKVEAKYKQVLPYRFYPLAEIKRCRGGEQPFESSFNYTQFNVLWQEDAQAGTQLNDQRGGVAE
ncbi:condensation domain-containing protein, partial [Rheinheimera gaetbuli]